MPQIGIAVERARMTHLWGEPVGLALENGVLAAISDEAAPFGIQVGQDSGGAKALCRNLVVLPYDREAYEEAAHCVWDLFAIESSFVEPVSPEVCFVEFRAPDSVQRVQQLSMDLAANVRIPIRAGLADSKFVARKAAESIRPNDSTTGDMGTVMGVMVPPLTTHHSPTHNSRLSTYDSILQIPSGREARFLARIPIDGVPGLDHKTRMKLNRLGVRTFGDVQKLPRKELTRHLKELGFLLHRLARGEDFESVRPLWPPRRLEESIVLEDETSDAGTVYEALRRCSESLAKMLGQNREFCRSITLQVHLADESRLEETEKLAIPANSECSLHSASMRLLRRIPLEKPLIGVRIRVGDLGMGSALQLALLDENRNACGLPHERERSLEAMIDFLRKRFGPGAVASAALMRQAERIGLWTYPLGHHLAEPVQVAIDDRGRPVRYWRRGRPRVVKRIHDRWRESEWFWGSHHEKTVYRVETDQSGLCELQSIGSTWMLSGIAD